MRRRDIQLLAAARQGDLGARIEVARRYLCGCDGFPQHLQLGLEYLAHPALRSHPQAQHVLVHSLPLHALLTHDLLPALRQVALLGDPQARERLALWQLTQPATWADALAGLAQPQDTAEPVPAAQAAAQFVRLSAAPGVDVARILPLAIEQALVSDDAPAAAWCLCLAARCLRPDAPGLAEITVRWLLQTAQGTPSSHPVPAAWIEAALQLRMAAGDPQASYVLGCALAGLPEAVTSQVAAACHVNLRKGLALLLRAADAGVTPAWMHLYRLSADQRSSVSNPTMARFFLERAAQHGEPAAQRVLGALLLRESETLGGNEQALQWLHQAGMQGDTWARRLMATLVLPVAGDPQAAAVVVQEIARSEPNLAARLAVARQFGLTKLEALTFDPASGLRAWGLVVGHNPHIRKQRLAAARAVPSLGASAMASLRHAAATSSSNGAAASFHQRGRLLQRWLARLGAQECDFFAQAPVGLLDALRRGPKWAWRVRADLRQALQCPVVHAS